jgi:hypothetical protein
MSKLLSVLCVVALLSAVALGQGVLGTRSAVNNAPSPQTYVGVSYPTYIYYNASLATGGVGLRNRAGGMLNVSGVTKPVQGAFVYWAVLTQTATIPVKVKSVTVARLYPTGAPTPTSATVTGTLIATGPDPCWGSAQIAIYRAAVPLNVAVGNGSYKIGLKAGASGLTDGSSPWLSGAKFPAFEGASLVLVGTGNATVEVFDTVLTGQTFFTDLEYYLDFYYTVNASNGPTILHLVGADGQTGPGFNTASGETTFENGIQIAGPGAANTDSDWDGTVAGPLPQLWDDTAHDITSIVNGSYYTYQQFNAPTGDCVTPIVNAVELR